MLISNLINSITDDNYLEVKQLSKVILDNNIKNLDELKKHEDYLFVFNGKELSKQERVDYCIKIYEEFPFAQRDISVEEDLLRIELFKQLAKEKNIDKQIKLLIKLYALSGKGMFFLCEAYDLIVNKKY